MENSRTERTPQRCFRYGYEDHLISKYPKPPKENEKRLKKVHFSERGNCACDSSGVKVTKICAPIERMYNNDKCSSGNIGDSLQLTDWILDSGATCHMMPEVSDFIPSLLEVT